MITFQCLIDKLQFFWKNQGCTIVQPLDIEVGAGTSHPITFMNALGKHHISAAYVQASRRPNDGRYGKNSNRLQHYYQFQVIIKPSPHNIQDLYIKSLQFLEIDLNMNDIRFIEDNWENPTLGAWGLGWEIWLNGMEITQFTYFQQMGGIECNPITVEITYGLERLAMYIQEVDNVYDIIWNNSISSKITYGDMFFQNEFEQSTYNFKNSDVKFLLTCFSQYKKKAKELLILPIPLPLVAYELTLKAIHNFNLLEARQAISVNERQQYILELHELTKKIAQTYLNLREKDQ